MNAEQGVLRVEKIGGGVSRYTKANIQTTIKNVSERGVAAQIYSAIRDKSFNATDNLIDLAEALNRGDRCTAFTRLEHIQSETERIIGEHYADFPGDTGLHNIISQQFEDLLYYISLYDSDEVLQDSNDYGGRYSIMGFGENLAAKIYEYLLRKEGQNVVYLSTEGMKTNGEKIKSMGELLSLMKQRVKDVLGDEDPSGKVIISPGFIENLLGGINGMIGRGFTDTVTGLVALALLDTNLFQKVVFEIQKDVAGILSTNPNDLSEPERVKLLEEVSIELAIKLFGEHGANSGLLNKSTINTYVIEALKNDSRFTVEIKNPDVHDGRKTTIKKSVDVREPKVDIIASRDGIRHQYRYLLGLDSQTSLYILGENLGLHSTGLIGRATSALLFHRVSGVNFSIHFGLDETLVVSFDNDSSYRTQKPLNAQDKSQIALDLLHYYLIEEPNSKIGSYNLGREVAEVT